MLDTCSQKSFLEEGFQVKIEASHSGVLDIGLVDAVKTSQRSRHVILYTDAFFTQELYMDEKHMASQENLRAKTHYLKVAGKKVARRIGTA